MKVCKSCKYVEIRGFNVDTENLDPMTFTCLHPECVDPITGIQIKCIEARNYPVYCGEQGGYYEEGEAKDSRKDEPTIIT